MKHVRVTDVIPMHSASCDVTTFSNLKDIYCPGNVHVDILIGQDYPHLLRPIDSRTGCDDDPFAVLTTLEWTPNGAVTSQPTKSMVTLNLICSTKIEKKTYQLSQFESARDVSAHSHKDIRKLQSWDNECRVVRDQFQILIPWRDSGVRLPDNLYLVNLCLDIVLESPHRKKVYEQYDNEISKMLSVAYAEYAPVDHRPTV